MATPQAGRDQNRITSLLGLSNADNGVTVQVWADPTTHRLLVSATGTYTISPSTTSTLANVNSSATSVTLLAANTNRLQATIFNDSTQVLYVKFGTTASSSSFTVKMVAGAYYELPQPVYTGRIDGIWASANGAARMTELT